MGLFGFGVEGCFVFGPGEVVLDWANGGEVLYTVFLSKLSGSNQMSIFVRRHSEVIVGKIENVLGAFKSNVK